MHTTAVYRQSHSLQKTNSPRNIYNLRKLKIFQFLDPRNVVAYRLLGQSTPYDSRIEASGRFSRQKIQDTSHKTIPGRNSPLQ
ncbi:MAG: hypothetical protein D4R77_00770 [Planctomycetaceae bacterium]|nr:MAG: hypothetical protein D4R77_00770 [Planctomycetaceae bacterium]